jgi:maltooligosyltrehalose trehalohydrolase
VTAVLTLTAPGTPMLFMGEEWGATTPWQFFTSHPEPELGEATAKGRIEEFEKMGWDPATVPDPQDPATFERSKLDWAEPAAGDHARLLQLYRDLARLRRELPELTDPTFADREAGAAEAEGGCTYWLRNGSVAVFANLSGAPADFAVGPGETVLLATDGAVELLPGRVTLPRDSAVIVGPQR